MAKKTTTTKSSQEQSSNQSPAQISNPPVQSAVEQGQDQDKQKIATLEVALTQTESPSPTTPQTVEELDIKIKDVIKAGLTRILALSVIQFALGFVTNLFARPVIAHALEAGSNAIPTTITDKKNELLARAEELWTKAYNTTTFALAYLLNIVFLTIAAPQNAINYALELPTKAKVAVIEKKDQVVSLVGDKVNNGIVFVDSKVGEPLRQALAPYNERIQQIKSTTNDTIQKIRAFVQQWVTVLVNSLHLVRDRLTTTVPQDSLDAKQQQELFRPRFTSENILQYSVTQTKAIIQPLIARLTTLPQSTNP